MQKCTGISGPSVPNRATAQPQGADRFCGANTKVSALNHRRLFTDIWQPSTAVLPLLSAAAPSERIGSAHRPCRAADQALIHGPRPASSKQPQALLLIAAALTTPTPALTTTPAHHRQTHHHRLPAPQMAALLPVPPHHLMIPPHQMTPAATVALAQALSCRHRLPSRLWQNMCHSQRIMDCMVAEQNICLTMHIL